MKRQEGSSGLPEGVSRPSLLGRRYSLVPLLPSHHEALYGMCLQDQIAFRWRYRGAQPQFEAFVRSLYGPNVLAQFVMEPKAVKGAVAGLQVAYNASLQDGTVYVASVSSAPRGSGALEGFALLVRHLFYCWNLRKLYLEVVEFNLEQFWSAVERGVLVEESRLREHTYFYGRYWDLATLVLYREQFEDFEASHPMLFAEGRQVSDDARQS